jgi:hypothetical protein
MSYKLFFLEEVRENHVTTSTEGKFWQDLRCLV